MGSTTMFGKSYDVVGSSNSNLLLKSKGDVKIQWGGKYIDLIKDGKIASSSNIKFEIIDDPEKISKDGIYLIDEDQVWVCISGNKISLNQEESNSISYLIKLELEQELKLMALKNIGFYYDTYEQANSAGIDFGLIYVINDSKVYLVNNGVLSEYQTVIQNELKKDTTSSILKVGDVTIDGIDNYVNFQKDFIIKSGNLSVIDYKNNTLKISYPILSIDYTSSSSGYRLSSNSLTINEATIRDTLFVENVAVSNKFEIEIENITNEDLNLIKDNLVINKTYRITNYPHGNLLVTALSQNELGEYCFEENRNWKIKYDLETNTIVSLTDEFNNTANFDFKHIKINEQYLFNNNGEDRSLTGDITNCDIIGKCVFNGIAKDVIIKNIQGTVVFNSDCLNTTIEQISNSIINLLIINSNIKGISGNLNTEIINCDIYSVINESNITENEINLLSSIYRVEGYVINNKLKLYTSVIPSGMIMMWNGTLNNIPYGWVICDGNNGTPNLIDKFVKASTECGDNDSTHLDNEEGVKANKIKIAENNLPAHSHPYENHTHAGSISLITIDTAKITKTSEKNGLSVDYKNNLTISGQYSDYVPAEDELTSPILKATYYKKGGDVVSIPDSGGDHSHSLSDPGHTHTVSGGELTIEETALIEAEKTWENDSIKIEPLSYSLIFIMKL